MGKTSDTQPGSPSLRFAGVSLDCPDPGELADFYLVLLGGRTLWRDASSAGVAVPGLVLICQRVAAYVPPVWPGTSIVHLDLTAGARTDLMAERAVSLGAVRPSAQPDERWQVLLDPAGHPFCITSFVPDAGPGRGDWSDGQQRHG